MSDPCKQSNDKGLLFQAQCEKLENHQNQQHHSRLEWAITRKSILKNYVVAQKTCNCDNYTSSEMSQKSQNNNTHKFNHQHLTVLPSHKTCVIHIFYMLQKVTRTQHNMEPNFLFLKTLGSSGCVIMLNTFNNLKVDISLAGVRVIRTEGRIK